MFLVFDLAHPYLWGGFERRVTTATELGGFLRTNGCFERPPRNGRRTHAPRVAMVPLGCAKAQVDAETMLGALTAAGYRIVSDPKRAGVVVINTCGFIQPAKEESLGAVFEALKLKTTHGVRVVAVTGCLTERYEAALAAEIPEADILLPWSRETELVHRLDEKLGIRRPVQPAAGSRLLLNPRHWAYLRISEGCNHRCAFCAIPFIRGKHTSVPLDDVVKEAKELAGGGAQELNIIAQDTTSWGIDLYGKPALPLLLRALEQVEGIRWLRVLYTHPAHIKDDLIELFASSARIVPYLDMPVQHINDVVLQRMNRIAPRRQIERILSSLRARVPGIVIRTTVVTGLPFETDRRFEELLDFVTDTRFDRLGCFVFSPEEGTEAARMTNRAPRRVAMERQAIIMEAQRRISRERNKACVGTTLPVLVEKGTRSGAIARSYAEAPEVDGVIRVRSDRVLRAGEWCDVRIVRADDYDLFGEKVAQTGRGGT